MIINYFMNFSPYFEIRNQREGWMNHIKLCEVSTWQEHWSIAKKRFLDRCNIEQWWRIKPSNIIIFTSVNKPTKIVIYIPGIFKAKEGEESFLSWSSLRSWHRMFNGCFFPVCSLRTNICIFCQINHPIGQSQGRYHDTSECFFRSSDNFRGVYNLPPSFSLACPKATTVYLRLILSLLPISK